MDAFWTLVFETETRGEGGYNCHEEPRIPTSPMNRWLLTKVGRRATFVRQT